MDFKEETSVWDRALLLAPPSPITLSQLPGKNTAVTRQAGEANTLILGNNWPSLLLSNICFKYFWRKLCIWQSESLCNVTYSVQFKVPLFLLSAGVGSHRGAVQPLHCWGSDCRGRQREGEICQSEYWGSCHIRWTQSEKETFLHLVTTPNKCYKMRRPQRYGVRSHAKHFFHTTRD